MLRRAFHARAVLVFYWITCKHQSVLSTIFVSCKVERSLHFVRMNPLTVKQKALCQDSLALVRGPILHKLQFQPDVQIWKPSFLTELIQSRCGARQLT